MLCCIAQPQNSVSDGGDKTTVISLLLQFHLGSVHASLVTLFMARRHE